MQLSAQDAARELLRRQRLDVTRDLYPLQRRIFRDPSRRVWWLAGRRSGKTFGSTRGGLVGRAQRYPGTKHLYIGLSRTEAKQLVWSPLQAINRERGLGMEFAHVDLIATTPEKSEVRVSGAPDSVSIERFRGHKYKTIVIDECASYGPFLNYLIEEILEPTLEDLDGTLYLIGTPSGDCQGLFYDVTTGLIQGWSGYCSTVLDNPRFPRWDGKPDWQARAVAWLEAMKRRKGWADDNAVLLREWMGQWVPSADNLIWHLHPGVFASRDEIPNEGLSYVLAIDLGFTDHAAFMVLGYSQISQKVFEVDNVAHPRLGLTQVVQCAKGLIERFGPELVVVDPASGGSHLAADLAQRYDFPVTTADKTQKAHFMRLLQDDFETGRAMLLAGSPTEGQIRHAQWNATFTREKEGRPFDLADCYLYGWRACMHWIAQDPEPELSEQDQILLDDDLAFERAQDEDDWY